jgi:hypothetical protein
MMAAGTSFKQQCPSCEAMVPIRDSGLIGRKIDCPKCKYRFVVQEPVGEDDDAPANKKKGAPGKPSAKGPGKPGGKTSPRRDDDDEDRPKKKEEGSSKMLVVGIGLAVVGAVALGVGGWALGLFGGGDSGTKTNSPSGTAPSTVQGTTTEQPKEAAPKTAEAAGPALGNVTNLLPNDTDIVISYPMDRTLGSSLKSAAIQSEAGFRKERFEAQMGFPLEDISRVLTAMNRSEGWVFTVVRTKKPYKQEILKANLRLAVEPKVKGKTGRMHDMYSVKGNLDSLGTLVLRANQAKDNFAVHFLDQHTLVFADSAPMKRFLEADGQPNHLSKPTVQTTPPPAATTPANPMGGGVPGPNMGAGGMPAMGGGRGGPGGGRGGPGGPSIPGAEGGPGGGGPPMPGAAGGGRGGPGGGRGGPGGAMVPGGETQGGAAGAGGEQGATPPAGGTLQVNYLTIAPGLKTVLDRVEKMEEDRNTRKKELAACITIAGDGKLFADLAEKDRMFGGISQVIFSGADEESWRKHTKESVLPILQAARHAACTLIAFDQTTIQAILAADLSSTSAAFGAEKTARPTLSAPLAQLKTPLKLTIRLSGSQQGAAVGGMAGMFGGAGSGVAMAGAGGATGGGGPVYGPGMGGAGGAMPPAAGSGVAGPPRGLAGAMGGPRGMGGMAGPPRGMGGSPSFPGGGNPMNPGGTTAEQDKEDGKLTLSAENSLVVLDIETNLNPTAYAKLNEFFERTLTDVRAAADLATKRSWPHELAAASQTYFKEKGAFPRGTLDRAASNGIGYRPDERLSWAVFLIPYLSEEYRGWTFDPNAGWNEGKNISLARRILPPLQGIRQLQRVDRVVRYPGHDTYVGATFFVGVAGLGLDAPEYAANDAATAMKRGVFGYDRVTRKEDIKDGLEQTIVFLMVPGDRASPWLAGGGSTVRGISDDPENMKPIAPFVCVEYPAKGETKSKWDGKNGTLAIMADGKVRFIPEDIPAATFRALCTIAGGEKIGKLDDIAPVIEYDAEREIKTGELLDLSGGKGPPATIVPGGKTSAAPAGPTWKEFTPASKLFTVKMPGEVQEQKRPAGNAQVMIYMCVRPGAAAFTVTVTDPPPGAAIPNTDKALDEFKAGLLNGVPGGKYTSEKKITLGTHPGRELLLEMPNLGSTKIRLYVVGKQVISVSAGPLTALNEKDVQTFFDSFQVNAK